MKRTPILVGLVCGVVVLAFALITGVTTARAMADAQARRDELTASMTLVPVAAKDIPIGRKVTTENVHALFVWKWFPREAVPPNALLQLEDLTGKRTMRTIRQGETVGAMDVNAKDHIDPPDGTILMTVPIATEPNQSGHLLPGYKVIVVATKKSQAKQKEIVQPLFLDVLILGIDDEKPGADERLISFAVTPDQSILLAMASEGGATIRVGLPNCGGFAAHETDTRVVLAQAKTADELFAFLDGE